MMMMMMMVMMMVMMVMMVMKARILGVREETGRKKERRTEMKVDAGKEEEMGWDGGRRE